MTSKCAVILLIVVVLNASICCNAIKKNKGSCGPVDTKFILGSGEKLNTGDSLQNNNYVLTMQQDCNLVLYDSGNLIWATNTAGLATNCYLTLQDNGNLVVYSPIQTTIWASNTVGSESSNYYVLILQKDRNLVIYGPAIWATASNA